jgi:hypothetical protein
VTDHSLILAIAREPTHDAIGRCRTMSGLDRRRAEGFRRSIYWRAARLGFVGRYRRYRPRRHVVETIPLAQRRPHRRRRCAPDHLRKSPKRQPCKRALCRDNTPSYTSAVRAPPSLPGFLWCALVDHKLMASSQYVPVIELWKGQTPGLLAMLL